MVKDLASKKQDSIFKTHMATEYKANFALSNRATIFSNEIIENQKNFKILSSRLLLKREAIL